MVSQSSSAHSVREGRLQALRVKVVLLCGRVNVEVRILRARERRECDRVVSRLVARALLRRLRLDSALLVVRRVQDSATFPVV